jgi:hypothetical protein
MPVARLYHIRRGLRVISTSITAQHSTNTAPFDTACGLTPCFGMAWEVVSALAPGQSITLSSNSLPPGYSIWPSWFAAGTSDLYAYADSFNPGVVAGAVAESDEANNRAELHGLTVTGPNPALVGLRSVAQVAERTRR